MNIKKIFDITYNFTLKRLIEIFGLIIILLGILFLVALLSYSPNDPNFIFPSNTPIKNILGFRGSFVADLFFQSIGLISYLTPITLIFTGINIFRLKDLFLIIENMFFLILYSIIGSLFFGYYYLNAFTLYIHGNGGFIGNYFNQTFLKNLIKSNENIIYYILFFLIIFIFFLSINFSI